MQQPRQGITPGQRFAGGAQPRRSSAMAAGQQPSFGAGRNPNAAAGVGGRRKKRNADRVISAEIRELVPESEAYMSLVAFEQKLDATLARKKLDFQEALKRPIKIKKKLRIFVSHSFTQGKEPDREGDEGNVPMWELRVEGRLLDEPMPVTASNAPAASSRTAAVNLPKQKFSSFFKSLVIELDKDIYGPDNHLVEWHRTPQTNETDGFQVKRPGDRDVKCTILLLLDHQPMKYKLVPRLAKLLGIAVDTRPKIIEALWQYIKTHGLQGESDRDSITCDEFLEPLFGCKRMRFMEIPQRLGPLLMQPDPLIIEHTIKYDGQDKNTICYDIEVELDDPIKLQMSNFIHNHANMPDIAVLDQKIGELIEQINEFKVRRDFYAGFAENPLEFTQKWLISQSKDIKTIIELNNDFEAERRAEFYYQPHIQEGVFRYIYGKIQQKRVELESTLGVRHN